MQISIKLNSTQANTALSGLLQAGQDMSPLFADLSELLLHSTQDRFETETDPDGLPWQALSEAYRQGKIERGEDPGILKQHGTMFDELASEFSSRKASITSNRVQSATHQEGDSRRGIPKRQFIGISSSDATEIIAAAEDYLRSAANG